MIRINQIKMPLHHNAAALEQKIRKRLGLSGGQELRYRIIRKSIDARKKPELSLVYSVEVSASGEEKIIKRANDPNVTIVKQTGYHLPGAVSPTPSIPPVIVGAGPAGLFCAYALTMSGCAPVVLERGRSVTERTKDVERFWESGVLDTVSNVQFGEGGAGTFSDGKLNTLVKDPTGRNRFVLETFVKFGAPEQILYENKPHIGTDILAGVIKNMRQAMEARGARFCFESCMITAGKRTERCLLRSTTRSGSRLPDSFLQSVTVRGTRLGCCIRSRILSWRQKRLRLVSAWNTRRR